MTRRFGAFFAILLLSALANSPAVAQPVRTILVSASDYPENVRPASVQLNVRVRYELAADGSVARCTVARSSGREGIDAASCRILRERARIRPDSQAMRGMLQFAWLGEQSLQNGNARGAPIPFSLADVMSVADYPMAALREHESGTVDYDVLVSENGVPQRCTVTGSSGSEALDQRTCEIVMTRGLFIPASDGAGGRRRGILHSRVRWVLP